MDAPEMIAHLWAHYDGDGEPVAWTLPYRRIRRIPLDPDGLEAFGRWVDETSDNEDVYYSVCAMRPGLAHGSRGTADDVVALPALWIDIDIADEEAHSASNLPATVQEALDILWDAPPCSLVVHSGYGLHVYWMLDEALELETPTDRLEAGRLVETWQAAFRHRCRARGWTLDATHDLARVLRLPGTYNHKRGEPRPVRVISTDDQWISPADARLWVASKPHAKHVASKGVGDAGRNDRIKRRVATLLGQHIGIDAIVADVVKYDAERHDPPLFSDRSEMRTDDPYTNALGFVASVTASIQRTRAADGLPPEVLGVEPMQRPTDAHEPLHSVSLVDVLADRTPRPDDIVGGYLDAGGRLVVGGPPKSMKSLIVVDLVAALATGRPWLGQPVDRPRNTLILNLEVNYYEMRERLRRAHIPTDAAHRIRVTAEGSPGAPRHVRWGISPKGIARVVAECDRAEFAPDVVVIDPLVNALHLDDENSSIQVRDALHAIDDLCSALGPHVVPIVVHHSRKISQADLRASPHDSLRGSGALRGWYTSSVVVETPDLSIPARVLHHESRGIAHPPTLVEYVAGRFAERMRSWDRSLIEEGVEYVQSVRRTGVR